MIEALAVVLTTVGVCLLVLGIYASLIIAANADKMEGGDDHDGNRVGMINNRPGAGGTSA